MPKGVPLPLEERLAARRASLRRYQQSERGREARRLYRQSPQAKEAQRRRYLKWSASDSGRRYLQEREKSPERRAAKARYQASPKGKEAQLRYHRRLRGILCQLRARSRRRGFDFDLKIEDMVTLFAPMRCAVTGMPLSWGDGTTKFLLSPSLDRIDNSRGYTRDNVHCVALWVNLARNDAPLEHLQAVLSEFKRAP